MEIMADITRILQDLAGGSEQGRDRLLEAVYDELRKLAAARLARERPGQTLEATALVHEAYLKLAGAPEKQFANRGHFFAAAAEAMRRILVDRARRKGRKRHGEGPQAARRRKGAAGPAKTGPGGAPAP